MPPRDSPSQGTCVNDGIAGPNVKGSVGTGEDGADAEKRASELIAAAEVAARFDKSKKVSSHV